MNSIGVDLHKKIITVRVMNAPITMRPVSSSREGRPRSTALEASVSRPSNVTTEAAEPSVKPHVVEPDRRAK
jgi:hypothetical protein